MTTPHIFITRRVPADKLAQLRQNCQVDLWDEELPPPHHTLLEHVQSVDVIRCLLTRPYRCRSDGYRRSAAQDDQQLRRCLR